MKRNSNHFHTNNGGGGPSNRTGKAPFKLDLQLFAKMPKQRAQIMHIMRSSEGHLIDTPQNRKILENLSDDKSSFKGMYHGNNVFSKVIDGKEYWVYERNGIIQNGGVNIDNFYYHKKGGK